MSPPPPPLDPPRVPLRRRLTASFSQSGRTLGLVWRSAPAGTIALAVLTLATAALPPFIAYVGKLIVDAVMAAHKAGAVRLVVVELVAVGVLALLERALNLVRQLVGS